MSPQTPQKPVKVFRRGRVQATIWLGAALRNGQLRPQLHASIQKRYRDKTTGEFKVTDRYYESDLADLISVARRALGYLERNEVHYARNPPAEAIEVPDDSQPPDE